MDLCALEQQSENLECEQQNKYCGVVKVHGDQLAFFPGFKSADANIDRSKVDRLKRIFKTEGCDRVNPTHQIPGNISSSQLALALKSSGLTADGLRTSPLTNPPFLYLPQGTFIHCLRGRSRIKALRELSRPDWWTIKLYADLSPAAQDLLSNGHDNDGPYSDGYIYAKVCEHQTTIQEKQWLSRLSKSKQGILKRLRSHPILGPAYANVLLQIPGMQEGLQIGTLPETISAKNYENVVHCLVHIRKAWVFIMGSEANLRYVDEDAVRELELRCPGISSIDEQHVTSVIRGGMAFHEVTDKAEREKLLERTKSVECLIPSLRTLQMDFKYVRRCTQVVKQLLLGDAPLECTVEQTAFTAFCYRKAEADRSDPTFQANYKLLCLHVMQNLTELSGEYPLLEDNEKPPSELVPDPRAWFNLAKQASDLGFKSQMIINRLSNDPDRVEAKRALLNARKPGLYSYESSGFDSLITTITDTFNKAHRVQETQQHSTLTCSSPGEPLSRRCGRQYSSAYFRDRYSLTAENFTCNVEKDADITSLFVRRSVFLAFWGLHDTDGQERFDISNEDEMDMEESPLEDTHMPDLPAFTRGKRPRGQPRAAGSGRSGLKPDGPNAPVKGANMQATTPAKGAIQPAKVSKPSQSSKPGSKSIQKSVERTLNKENQDAQKAKQKEVLATEAQVEIRNMFDKKVIRTCRRQSVIQAVEGLLRESPDAHLFDKEGRGIVLEDCVNVDCVVIDMEL